MRSKQKQRQMMTLRVFVLAFLLALAAQAQGVTRAQVDRALANFFAEPTAPLPNRNLAVIMRYAAQSDDIDIVIDKAVMPWMDEPSRDEGALLMGAYTAGNLEAQLNGHRGDQPRAGLMRTFQVYDAIRKEHPDYRSPGLQKLRQLNSQGKLNSFLRQHHKS